MIYYSSFFDVSALLASLACLFISFLVFKQQWIKLADFTVLLGVATAIAYMINVLSALGSFEELGSALQFTLLLLFYVVIVNIGLRVSTRFNHA